MKKITALKIKHALMSYFRFRRQWLCASECLCADVLAITDKDIIEVEIKISKSDLWHGEAKKNKHNYYKNENPSWFDRYHANKFYVCVPKNLLEEAKKWVEATNKKYGVIEYDDDVATANSIFIAKSAATLHETKKENLERSIMMRVCTENIGLIQKLFTRKTQKINIKSVPKINGEYKCQHVKRNIIKGDCVWCNLTIAEKGLEVQKQKVKEIEIVLNAWHEIFGTTQLTHAAERLRVAEEKAHRYDELFKKE